MMANIIHYTNNCQCHKIHIYKFVDYTRYSKNKYCQDCLVFVDRNKKIILTLFGYLISVFLLVVVFKDTNFEKIFEYLKKIDPFLALLALLLNIIFVWIRGVYQKNNLYITTPNIRTGTSIVSIGISLFYNAILPTRLGDVIRTVFISLRDNIKKKDYYHIF